MTRMANYWLLKLKGGDEIRIKPSLITAVKTYMDSGGIIHTATRSIPVDQITSFEETDIPYIEHKQVGSGLLEDAARAFKQPLYIDDNTIQVKWVKKQVTTRKWNNHYSHIPAYKLIDDDGSHALIRFRLPIHQINNSVTECSPDEIQDE